MAIHLPKWRVREGEHCRTCRDGPVTRGGREGFCVNVTDVVKNLTMPRAATAAAAAALPAFTGLGAAVALTRREREIVRCVGVGLRNAEVAEKLGVSEGTVKTHLNNIFQKLGVRDRVVRRAGELPASWAGAKNAGTTGRDVYISPSLPLRYSCCSRPALF